MKKLTAKDIMNENVLSVSADLSLQGLAGFLLENSISGAPVTDTRDMLIGVVSITDLIHHETLLEKVPQKENHQNYYVHTMENRFSQQDIDALHLDNEPLLTVADIMTPKILEVAEADTVQQVADTMIRHRVHRVFVTRRKEPVGIISAADMLKVIRDMGD